MLRQLRGSLSHHLQGFVHPRWVAGFLPSTVCLFHGDTFGTKRLGITKQWPLRSQNNQHDVMFEAWNMFPLPISTQENGNARRIPSVTCSLPEKVLVDIKLKQSDILLLVEIMQNLRC